MLIKFKMDKDPIKNKILFLGLVLNGINTKINNIKANKIFSIKFVVKFLEIESLFKILLIMCACTSTPGTAFPFGSFTISKIP